MAGSIVALGLGIATLRRWNHGRAPETHYIASRMKFEPKDEDDAKWLAELDTLQLPDRHTVC